MKNIQKNVLYILSVLIVLSTIACGGASVATPAQTPAQVSADPNMGDRRLLDEISRLRLEVNQLRVEKGSAADKPSLVPGVGNPAQPSATIVQGGASMVRYDPRISAAIPSRTVYLPGEKRAFVSFEGLGGWAICAGSQGAWGPVNLNGRMVPGLMSEMAGCIVATDCPTWDPDGICRKELTIIWMERSNPSHVVNRKTVMVEMQRCSRCASIGGACYQRGPRQVCAGG